MGNICFSSCSQQLPVKSVQETATRAAHVSKANPNDVLFARGQCPEDNLTPWYLDGVNSGNFCGKTELNLFPVWGTRRGGVYQQKRSENIPPLPPQTALSLSFLLPRLVSPDHPCSLVLSVQQLLVTHVCTVRVCWRGMLAILIWEASAHLTFLTKESAVLRLHYSGTHSSAIVLRCAHVCYTQNCPAETRCTGCSVHCSKPCVYTVSVL